MVFTTSSGRVHAVNQNTSSPLHKASQRNPLNGHSTRGCQRPWPFASGYHLDGVPEVCQGCWQQVWEPTPSHAVKLHYLSTTPLAVVQKLSYSMSV